MVDIESNLYPPPTPVLPATPPGLSALYLHCRNVYPDQPNPLQVSAVLKYWLGGPDPLDYISMYSNPGSVELGVPPHWHYISFGFSDLHGDGRVHETNGPDDPSGFGFELTFRLKREPSEISPPTWPAQLLQALAKYVFHSDNVFKAGDHVSWNKALDSSESLIEHMLLFEDPQLGTVQTPNGSVMFIQIVGVTQKELEAAQQWTPHGVIEILKKIPGGGGGGCWLVTDMRRGMSMFELDPNSAQSVKDGIKKEGSNLSGVSSFCYWKDLSADEEKCDIEEDEAYSEYSSKSVSSPQSQASSAWLNDEQPPELRPTRTVEKLSLVFNRESGNLLRLAIRGRVMHGRHFTFKAVTGDCVITFVGEGVMGTNVEPERPYVARGPWLQVLIPESFAEELAAQFDLIDSTSFTEQFPKTFRWPERGLSITIENDLVTFIPPARPVL